MLRFCMVVLIAGILAGCAQMTSAPKAGTAATSAPNPHSFGWETGAIEASGTGAPPSGVAGPQRVLGARNAAKVAALKSVKTQVRELPISSDQTVGSVMDKYLAIRRAVEKQLQSAEVVSEEQNDKQYQVRVRLALQPIADMLRQNYINPTEELPAVPTADDSGVAPVT